MVRVLLDTSALMMPVESDVRLFEELERLLLDVEALVPGAVLRELEHLAAGGGTEASAARVGHDLARERCRVIQHDAADADAALIELASAGSAAYVCTNDGPLRTRLLDAGVSVVSLRGTQKLTLTRA